jgi:hypothetical protein
MFGNEQCSQAAHSGTVQLTLSIIRSNVLYVPGLLNNLISTSATPKIYTWDIDNTCARLSLVYLSAPVKNRLYILTISPNCALESQANFNSKANLYTPRANFEF